MLMEKYMYKGMLIALLMLAHSSAFAGKISELFADGAFGVKWGADIKQVREVHPEGEIKEYVGILNYVVPHSKPVLKINRRDSEVTFTFDSTGKLHAIGISFEGSDVVELFSSLKTYFGENKPLSNSPRIEWEKDGSIKMYLLSMPSGFSVKPILTIENVATKNDASKDELGFN